MIDKQPIIDRFFSYVTIDTESDPNSETTPSTEPLLVNALQNATATDWKDGILSGTLTQLPLTTLNSCLSVCMLAHSLFPAHDKGCLD